jgi:hypothetical protein
LRKLATAVFATSLAVFGLVAPGPRVASADAAVASLSNVKVVLIVGPVAGATSYYRSDADDAATEARKYTSNVITIYSPTATWSKVKPALQGASIVVYMGHGNGSPGPYGPFNPLTEDGLGLNPSAGTDNTKTKYYGESYIASGVRLASNAVVFLGHLCYSAGNSEPLHPDPTLGVAKQRVDNMAAGWIKAGARSVVAEPYAGGMWGGAAWYIHQLFTTDRTMDAIFRSSPNFNNHVLSFASIRSSGYTARMDPGHVNAPPFKRSIVGDPGLLSVDVVGGRHAATGVVASATYGSSGAAYVSGSSGFARPVSASSLIVAAR